MYKNRSQGFTLIELLVVIAIIGILSAVVLASLNTARQKGNDAAIQSDLSTIQTQAEIYYGGAGANSYGAAQSASCAATTGTLWSDATIVKAVTGAQNASGAAANVVCNSTPSAYAVSAQLTAVSGTYWCVDSTGTAKQETAALGTLTACQ